MIDIPCKHCTAIIKIRNNLGAFEEAIECELDIEVCKWRGCPNFVEDTCLTVTPRSSRSWTYVSLPMAWIGETISIRNIVNGCRVQEDRVMDNRNMLAVPRHYGGRQVLAEVVQIETGMKQITAGNRVRFVKFCGECPLIRECSGDKYCSRTRSSIDEPERILKDCPLAEVVQDGE